MTVETRYMREDGWHLLGLEQTAAYAEYDEIVGSAVTVYWASDVSILHADTSETTIGTKVAQVKSSVNGEGIESNTWVVALQALVATDCIRARIYQKMGTADWVLCQTFTTEVLGANQLDAATWTFYYWVGYVKTSRPTTTEGWFRWGDSTRNSRIENFTWSVGAPSVGEFHGDGLTFWS